MLLEPGEKSAYFYILAIEYICITHPKLFRSNKKRKNQKLPNGVGESDINLKLSEIGIQIRFHSKNRIKSVKRTINFQQ